MNDRIVKASQEIIVEEKREQKRSLVRVASSCAVCANDRGAWKNLAVSLRPLYEFQNKCARGVVSWR